METVFFQALHTLQPYCVAEGRVHLLMEKRDVLVTVWDENINGVQDYLSSHSSMSRCTSSFCTVNQ